MLVMLSVGLSRASVTKASKPYIVTYPSYPRYTTLLGLQYALKIPVNDTIDLVYSRARRG